MAIPWFQLRSVSASYSRACGRIWPGVIDVAQVDDDDKKRGVHEGTYIFLFIYPNNLCLMHSMLCHDCLQRV